MTNGNCGVKFILIAMVLTGCAYTEDQAGIPEFELKVASIPQGASAQQIQSELGPPQRVFTHPASGRVALYYCLYGWTKEVSETFWVSETTGFYARGGIFDERAAIEVNPAAISLWNCYDGIIVNWGFAPEPRNGTKRGVFERPPEP